MNATASNRIVALTLAILATRPADGFADRLTLHFDGIPSTADVQVALESVGDSDKFKELLQVSELPELADLTGAEVEDTAILECVEPGGGEYGRIFVEYVTVIPVTTVEVS